MVKMLLEIKFYYDDDTVSHDLIECENPSYGDGYVWPTEWWKM